jgi:hypothetical protein
MLVEAFVAALLVAPQAVPPPPSAPAPPPAAAPEASPWSLSITLVHDDERSRATRDQLLRLLATYPLERWIFTREVLIDSSPRVIPHSHPVLTLNTRYVRDDELALSTFVHEQLHWHLLAKGDAADRADAALRRLFPTVPTKPPEGARDETSTYLHLALCYLEYQALRELLGHLRARWVIEFYTTHHYTWVYQTVLERTADLGRIVDEYGLAP